MDIVPAARVVVIVEERNEAHRDRALALAQALRLQVHRAGDLGEGEFALTYHNDVLELRDAKSKPGRGVSVDFGELNPARAAGRGGFSRSQPLARAAGKGAQRILDATAGLGHDAALLSCMGYRVTAVERSPIVAALLQDGLRRAMEDPQLRPFFEHRLEVINADARDVLQGGSGEFDAVYIDPMFPPKRKSSALAKKSIRVVRSLVGDDQDAGEMLAAAQRSGAARIVVKRPHHAPPLAPNPTTVIKSKLVRYDVYCRT